MPGPPANAKFFTTGLRGVGTVRWERHKEFQTYTIIRGWASARDGGDPFDPSVSPLALLPAWWLQGLPGTVVTALEAAVLEDSLEFDRVRELFSDSEAITAAQVTDGQFVAYSDFRPHGDTFNTRLLIHGRGSQDTPPNRRTNAGITLRRFVDVDKYHRLALMALPLAQELSPRVDRLNASLRGMTGLDTPRAASPGDQRTHLDELCRLSAQSLQVLAQAAPSESDVV